MAPIGNDMYLTVNDLKDFKILALTIIVISGLNLLKFLVSLFSSERKELNARVKDLEEMSNKIDHKMDQIMVTLAQVKDSQITLMQVQDITRKEIEFIEKYKNRN